MWMLKVALFALVLYAVLEIVWNTRSSQSGAVSHRWFRFGRFDSVFVLLFQPDGAPRKYTWLVQLCIGGAILYIAWRALWG